MGGDWALLIQGPLHSPLPGNSWLRDLLEREAANGRPMPAVNTDCTDAVLATVRNARPWVQNVVLSTWSDALNASMVRRIAGRLNCDIVLTEDPGRGEWSLGPLPDNRRRQVLSTLRGLDHVLGATTVRHVVRTRTDQVVDVGSIVAAVSEQAPDDRPRTVGQLAHIHVAGVLATVPYAIDDFYFAGRAEDLWRFFDAQWRLRHSYRGVDSVHADLVVKHLWCNLRGRLPGVSMFEFFPVVDARRDLDHPGRRGALGARYLDLWATVLRHSLKPLPRAVYETLTFRGVPYRTTHQRIFLEEWQAHDGDLRGFYRSNWPEAFTDAPFGAAGLLLNYAPECAWIDAGGLPGELARRVHLARRTLSGRFAGRRPQLLRVGPG
jgi:WavE lipopolysaccharide synthesis